MYQFKMVKQFVNINPMLERNHGVALWCVYGQHSFPQLMGCQILPSPTLGEMQPHIWGFTGRGGDSSSRRSQFRALGVPLESFYEMHHHHVVFFSSQREALRYLGYLTAMPVALFRPASFLVDAVEIECHSGEGALTAPRARPPESPFELVLEALRRTHDPSTLWGIYLRVRYEVIKQQIMEGRADYSIWAALRVSAERVRKVRQMVLEKLARGEPEHAEEADHAGE